MAATSRRLSRRERRPSSSGAGSPRCAEGWVSPVSAATIGAAPRPVGPFAWIPRFTLIVGLGNFVHLCLRLPLGDSTDARTDTSLSCMHYKQGREKILKNSFGICRVKKIPPKWQDSPRMMVVGGRVTRLGVPKSAATAGTAEVLHIEAFDPSVEWHDPTLRRRLKAYDPTSRRWTPDWSAKFNVLGLRRRLDARLPFRAREP